MSKAEDFNHIYKAYYEKTCRFARLYVRDEWVAEDIAIESLTNLWLAMQKGTVDKPLALLLTILKNKSLDYLRRQATAKEALQTMAEWQQKELSIRIFTLESCNPDNIYSEEIRDILADTLEKLSLQTRRVFMMSRFGQKTAKEIAAELNITVKGVDYHIAKSLKALRIALKDYLPFFFFFLN